MEKFIRPCVKVPTESVVLGLVYSQFFVLLCIHWAKTTQHMDFYNVATIFATCIGYGLVCWTMLGHQTFRYNKFRKQWLKEMHERRSTPYKFFF